MPGAAMNPDTILTAKQVAEILGYKSIATARSLMAGTHSSGGRIRSRRVGNRLYTTYREVLKFIEER